jgi:hypothetical protein
MTTLISVMLSEDDYLDTLQWITPIIGNEPLYLQRDEGVLYFYSTPVGSRKVLAAMGLPSK